MRVFKPKFKDKTTKQKYSSPKWYIDFKDHTRTRRKLPAFADKRASAAFGRKIETLVSLLIAKEPPDAELQEWINGLPEETAQKLMKWGLISGQRAQAKRPIKEHLAEYVKVLKARRHSADYVSRMESRVKRICEDCKFVYFRQIKQSTVELYLGKMEEGGYSATSRAHYLDAIRTFINWAKRDHRITMNPLELMDKPDRNEDKKGVLTPEQFMTLIQKTAESTTRLQRTTGQERAMMYLLAGATGLRRRELLLLKWDDLHLDEASPYVLARQDTTKNAQKAEQPIPPSLANLLKPAQAQHRPDDRVFRFAMSINTAWLIREDLKAAGLPLTDRDGNEICFHSLRNSYISFLANSNTPMKIVQKLARHSDPKLTYNTYARAFEEGEKLAVKSLPDIARFNLSFCLSFSGELRRTETEKRGQVNLTDDVKTAFSSSYELPPRGLEPLLPG